MILLRLAFRLLRRGPVDLLLLLMTLALASGGLSALFGLEAGIERKLSEEHAQLLGADLVASATHPLPRAWLEEAKERGLSASEKVTLATVLLHGDRMALAGVEAVDGAFPLRGAFELKGAGRRARPPELGTIWLSPSLSLALGHPEEVTLGERRLRVAGELLWSPAAGFSLQHLLPRAVVRLEDLSESGLLGPGSQALYSQLFAGSPERLSRFRAWLEEVKDPQVRLSDRPEPLRRSYERGRHLLALLKLLLAAIAAGSLALAGRSYVREHLLETVAVLRSLGLGRRKTFLLLALLLLLAALTALLPGLLLAAFLGRLSPFPEAGIDLLQTPLLLPLLLLGTLGPLLWRLSALPPRELLQSAHLPAPSWLEGAAFALTALLLGWWLGTWLAVGLFLGGALVLALLGRLSLEVGRRLLPGRAGRIASRRLRTLAQTATFQIAALALVLGALGSAELFRSELIEEWRAQIPKEAPNHFAVNLFPQDLERFKRGLEALGARLEPFFPIVKGRLIAVDGEPVSKRVRPGSLGEVALRRDLNLTATEELPRVNRIVAGRWWQGRPERPQVSLEVGFAEGIGTGIGSRLTFAILGERLEAEVVSLREVAWSSLAPNFFAILSPGALDPFPATYMTAFYLPPGREAGLVRLARDLPHVTLLEVTPLLEAFRALLQRTTGALELLLLLALALGLLLVASAVVATLRERREEALILRGLGARRGTVFWAFALEFLLLGLLAGLLAIPLAEGLYGAVAWRRFHLAPSLHAELLLLPPLAALGLLLLAAPGLLRFNRLPPADLLR